MAFNVTIYADLLAEGEERNLFLSNELKACYDTALRMFEYHQTSTEEARKTLFGNLAKIAILKMEAYSTAYGGMPKYMHVLRAAVMEGTILSDAALAALPTRELVSRPSTSVAQALAQAGAPQGGRSRSRGRSRGRSRSRGRA